MSVNKAALDLIKEFEGLVLEAYPDPAHGWQVPSIGYGHTNAAGSPRVTRGLTITAEEAQTILLRDLQKYEHFVHQLVTVDLNENQFGALVSFCFNLGPANLEKSTLLRLLNRGDFKGAAREFSRWNKAAGKVMAGLSRRRAAEAKLFSTPAKSSPETPPTPAPKGLWPMLIGLGQFLLDLLLKLFKKG